MLIGIQIIGILFTLFMLYITFIRNKRDEISYTEQIIWFIFWGLFGLITIFPQILNPITIVLHVSRTLDFLIIGGFLFMIGISYYNYGQIKQFNQKIEVIVKHIAWEEAEKKK